MTEVERAASHVDHAEPVADEALAEVGQRLVAAHNQGVVLQMIARLAESIDLPIPALTARCERQRREMQAAQDDLALLTSPTTTRTTH